MGMIDIATKWRCKNFSIIAKKPETGNTIKLGVFRVPEYTLPAKHIPIRFTWY